MDIILRAKNCEVPARVKDEARDRLTHATRIFDRLLGVEVTFSEETNPRIPEPAVVEVTARTKGHLIRALGSGDDHRVAIDQAIDRFERQLRRYKTRLIDRHRKGKGETNGQVASVLPTSPPADAEEDDGPRIVRRKAFELTPMLPDEAALQLELLGHDFYLFTNAATGRCNVVYRRRDGDIGLIEALPQGAEADEVAH